MAEEQQGNEQDAKIKKELARRYREMQIEQEKKQFIRKLMDADAYDRLMNVRVANYDMYMQLLDLIINMARSNRLSGKLTDEQMRNLLSQLTSRPASKIEFHHK